MEEIDLKEIINLIWEQKIKVILIIAIFAMIGMIYTFGLVTPQYSSSTTLILVAASSSNSNDASITTTDLTMNAKLVSTYSELIKSKSVLRKVLNNLDIDMSEGKLRKDIDITSVKNTELIKITVSNENSEYACKIANEIAKVFMEEIKGIYNIQNVQVVDEAEVSANPSNRHYKRDIAIFVLIGLVVAMADLFIENMLDTTVKDEEDIEKVYHIPVLAAIPVYEEEQTTKEGGRR